MGGGETQILLDDQNVFDFMHSRAVGMQNLCDYS